MIENTNRIAAFTSSDIFALCTNDKTGKGIGSKGQSYITEKKIELRMNRSVDVETYSRSMAWGLFLEQRVFDLLGFEYELCSQNTDSHPTISHWSGSKDFIVPGKRIAELKCYEPKNFALYTDAILKKDIAFLREEFPKEYWQLVSNSIICQVPNAEAITYMPYKSELPIIREMAENYDGADQWKYRFIAESPDAALPYLPDGGYYKNLNRFEFEVPKEDKDFLTSRILLAKNILLS